MKLGISLASVALGALVAVIGPASGQVYPSHPITLAVPTAPGGGNDAVARMVATEMSKQLGQPIIVDNRPGAGGMIATRHVARSEPDGYTLGIGNSATMAILPLAHADVGYDPRKDLTPIGLIATSPLVLLVNSQTSVQSLQELIALAKQEPGKLTYASGGADSPTHLSGEMLAVMAGISITHIAYKGTGPAMGDLLGGHVLMMFSSLPPAIGLIQAGKVRALAVTSAERSAIFPDVPTIAEAGLPGYEATQRYGIIAPAHMPAPIVERLNAALRQALASDDVRRQITHHGGSVSPGSAEDYAASIDRDGVKWSTIVRRTEGNAK